ncbi:hypothetical protein J7E97_08060 [Streptomyces sp. ISL-66]|uniref:hypothetical protein n=1 Tax=Streptomyces sp. ISL-66 TaxID=2819186 RepID=UPI001BE81FE8|nr:hypothetical protein [Streptomyces sp. ISL-66]MBT2467827.1 hypothetical protein [Streptomyces sp. ISL-66]
MPSTVTSLTARRSSMTVEDALASIHAGAISEYLAAALVGSKAGMRAVRSRAHALDIAHPGGPSLVDQLDALRTQAAA